MIYRNYAFCFIVAGLLLFGSVCSAQTGVVKLSTGDLLWKQTAARLNSTDNDSSKKPDHKKRIVSLRQLGKSNQFRVEWEDIEYQPWGGYLSLPRNAKAPTHTGKVTAFFDGESWLFLDFCSDTALRPINSAPANLAKVSIRTWNRKSSRFEEFDESVAPIDQTQKTVVLVHGLGESCETGWFIILARQIVRFDPGVVNILAVDWREYAQYDRNLTLTTPIFAIPAGNKIPLTAQCAANFLFTKQYLELVPEKTHIIGFSHGAHTAAMICQNVRTNFPEQRVSRLTLLDPSNDFFHWSWENWRGKGWNGQSAAFLDLYRTTTRWISKNDPCGRAFLVVSEAESPASNRIQQMVDNHYYAPFWFGSTIGKASNQYGYGAKPQFPVINTEQKKNQAPVWSGLIVSNVPKNWVWYDKRMVSVLRSRPSGWQDIDEMYEYYKGRGLLNIR